MQDRFYTAGASSNFRRRTARLSDAAFARPLTPAFARLRPPFEARLRPPSPAFARLWTSASSRPPIRRCVLPASLDARLRPPFRRRCVRPTLSTHAFARPPARLISFLRSPAGNRRTSAIHVGSRPNDIGGPPGRDVDGAPFCQRLAPLLPVQGRLYTAGASSNVCRRRRTARLLDALPRRPRLPASSRSQSVRPPAIEPLLVTAFSFFFLPSDPRPRLRRRGPGQVTPLTSCRVAAGAADGLAVASRSATGDAASPKESGAVSVPSSLDGTVASTPGFAAS